MSTDVLPDQGLLFLSRAATRLLELQPGDDLAGVIADGLLELVPDACVIVCDYLPAHDVGRLAAVRGLGELRGSVEDLLGGPPEGLSFPMVEALRADLATGRVTRVQGGLSALVSGLLPPLVARGIEEAIGLQAIWMMGLTRQSVLLGCAALLRRAAADLPHRELVEVFIQQAGIALMHRRTEQALRESEERYRRLVEQQSEGIGVVDEREVFTFANPAAHEQFGVPPGALIGRSPLDFMDEVQRGIILAQTGRRQTGERSVYEFDITRPDGQRRTFVITATPNHDAAGRYAGAFGIFRDVTDQRRAQASRQLLATAAEQAAEAIVITDAQGRIVYVNPAFEKVSGYAAAEAIGQNPRILQSRRQPPAFYQRLWETLHRGEHWHGRFVNRRKDGTLYEEDATISPVRDERGAITHYVAVKRDVSREVQLEDQLRQSQKMEAIGTLAGGVAHDFNNILAVILCYCDVVLSELPTDARLHGVVQEIQGAGQRAASLTRQLLAFSRKQRLQPRLLDLNAVVSDMEKMLRRLIGEHLELVTRLGADPGLVRVDPSQLDQVIMNLAVNARDAMPHGGRLILETAPAVLPLEGQALPPDVPGGPYVRLSISDTGGGIDEATRARLFEPFFTTKGLGRGTGLGLATVYGIVKQSGGHIQVASEPGVRTTFDVFLPRANAPTAAADDAREGTPAARRRGTERVLVAEDEESIRVLIQRVLAAQGYAVTLESDGAAAYERFSESPEGFDLLITDVVMPRMDGRELADACQALRTELPVLFISGYAEDVLSARGVSERVTDFLAKPFTVAALLGKVREALER
jgi:PAS domain S-box-containing protein